jgi:hypothetical protein
MLIWIMGASAVGKKNLIARAVKFDRRLENFTPAWIPCGPIGPDEEAQVAEGDHLLRWQWGREASLRRFTLKDIPQQILLVTADAQAHYERAKEREKDREIWPIEQLVAEAQEVKWLAFSLAFRFNLSILQVDVTSKDPSQWRRY